MLTSLKDCREKQPPEQGQVQTSQVLRMTFWVSEAFCLWAGSSLSGLSELCSEVLASLDGENGTPSSPRTEMLVRDVQFTSSL